MLWLSQYERLDDAVVNFANEVRGTAIADDPLVQDWYGTLLIDAMALRLLGYRTVAESARGKQPAWQLILKLLGSEAAQAAAMHDSRRSGPTRCWTGTVQHTAQPMAPRRVHAVVVQPVPPVVRHDHRRRYVGDPAQHHR